LPWFDVNYALVILYYLQPFPFQASSLFGGSVPQSNPVTFGPVGIGNAPRHINIHIHAGKKFFVLTCTM
jgi:hypothetical protein